MIHNSPLLSRRKWLAALVFLLCFGCDERPSGVSSRTWDKPCDNCISGVENFAKVSSALWRGAQPTAEGFRGLEAAGVKTVINLCGRHDDAPLLKGTKLKYVRVFARAWDPEEKELAEVLKVIANRDNWPVFVHCAQGGDRTGYVVATYRMLVDGWSADDALREMYDFHFNTIWFRNPGFLRGMNIENARSLGIGAVISQRRVIAIYRSFLGKSFTAWSNCCRQRMISSQVTHAYVGGLRRF